MAAAEVVVPVQLELMLVICLTVDMVVMVVLVQQMLIEQDQM